MQWALAVLAVVGVGTVGAQAPSTALDNALFAAGRSSINIEALFMWFKASPTPVPVISDYYVDVPGTNVLLGGGSLDTNPNPGFRLSGTYDVNARWGLEAVAFYVPKRSTTRSVASDGTIGSVDLFVPFYNVTIGREDLSEVSLSPVFSGYAQEKLSNSLGGGEINARWPMALTAGWRGEFLAGVRYLQLKEDYSITTSSPDIPPFRADIFDTTDQFNTSNRFFGAQVGVRAGYDSGPWVGSVVGKVALGSMKQSVSINGFTSTNDFNDYGPAQTFAGGYFALPSNSGDHSRNVCAVVPEVGLSLGYRVAHAATFYVGYNILYASNVVRPGNQVNRNINPNNSVAYTGDPPTATVTPAQPAFDFHDSTFWAQSFTLGFNYRF